MSNGEMYIVAKPRFETNSAGLSEISIVDVWIVPDNGQGLGPARIGDRGGQMPQLQRSCSDPQRLYEPLQSNQIRSVGFADSTNQIRSADSFNLPFQQHMTLIRTPQGWQIQYDVDPRLQQSNRIPISQQYSINPQFQNQGIDQRMQYRDQRMQCPCPCVDQRMPYRVQDSRSQHQSVDPRVQYRIQTNQEPALDPRLRQLEFQRRYLEMQIQQERMRSRSPQQSGTQYRPPQRQSQGSRATFGVDPSIGLGLDQRNQEMRREIEWPDQRAYNNPNGQYVPQGRARFGVDPRTAAQLADRDLYDRQQIIDSDAYQQQRAPQQRVQPQQGYQPRPQATDSTRWAPKNTRSWEDNLDFDPDGTKIGQSVGNYLNKYGPPARRPAAGPNGVNPNGVYAPQSSPFSVPGIISNGVDSSLRSFGDYLRGR